MEEEITRKPYVTSEKFFESRSQVYYYGLCNFGYFQAVRYDRKIEQAIETLSERYRQAADSAVDNKVEN